MTDWLNIDRTLSEKDSFSSDVLLNTDSSEKESSSDLLHTLIRRPNGVFLAVIISTLSIL